MMGWYGSGGWGFGSWIGMGLGMLIFWGLVIFAVVALFRWSGGRHPDHGAAAQGSAPGAPSTSALATLDERFARGDLTEDEYRRTRDILLGR